MEYGANVRHLSCSSLLQPVWNMTHRWYRLRNRSKDQDNYYVKTFSGLENLPDHVVQKVTHVQQNIGGTNQTTRAVETVDFENTF